MELVENSVGEKVVVVPQVGEPHRGNREDGRDHGRGIGQVSTHFSPGHFRGSLMYAHFSVPCILGWGTGLVEGLRLERVCFAPYERARIASVGCVSGG